MGLFSKDYCVDCGRDLSGCKKLLIPFENKYICEDCQVKKLQFYGVFPKDNDASPIEQKVSAKVSSNWTDMITPQTLNEFVGQQSIKDELTTVLSATEKHKIPVQHILFSGSYGLGKTTIAKIFASKLGRYEYINATDLRADTFPHNVKALVIDEIHMLRDDEWLLTIMDTGVPTIIGATTTAGTLSGALRSRFVSMVLQPYNNDDLKIIIKQAAKRLKYDCPDFVSDAVSQRGKATARVALFLFKRIYDRIVLNPKVTPEMLNKWFKEMNIDKDGLDNSDRAFLKCLSDKPVGLQNISAMTGIDRTTIEEAIEPFLLTRGFVVRTSRGRVKGDMKPIEVW
jgi:holliday junction DNA helicase RuvB